MIVGTKTIFMTFIFVSGNFLTGAEINIISKPRRTGRAADLEFARKAKAGSKLGSYSQVAGDVGIGEAHRTGQVASIGQDHVCQNGVRGVPAAQSAFAGGRFGRLQPVDSRARGCRIVSAL